MRRPYSSFVLRCWRLGSGQHRIEIEHVQSGARARVNTLPEAVDWIDARSGPVLELLTMAEVQLPPEPAAATDASPEPEAGGTGAGRA